MQSRSRSARLPQFGRPELLPPDAVVADIDDAVTVDVAQDARRRRGRGRAGGGRCHGGRGGRVLLVSDLEDAAAVGGDAEHLTRGERKDPSFGLERHVEDGYRGQPGTERRPGGAPVRGPDTRRCRCPRNRFCEFSGSTTNALTGTSGIAFAPLPPAACPGRRGAIQVGGLPDVLARGQPVAVERHVGRVRVVRVDHRAGDVRRAGSGPSRRSADWRPWSWRTPGRWRARRCARCRSAARSRSH